MEEHDYCNKPKSTIREHHNCCVPQCSTLKNNFNHLPRFPTDQTLRKKWILAIKTGKKVTNSMRVCSNHFKPDDYIFSSKYDLINTF